MTFLAPLAKRRNIMPPFIFYLLFSASFFLPASLLAQNIALHFSPVFKGDTLLASRHSGDDSLAVHTLKFYLSHFSFLKNGKEIWQEKNSFHLLDMEEKNTLTIILKPGKALDFDAIKFNLGIDSLTNVSGAFGGDLDPTKGTYWAWNSGYINFKIEGYAKNCPARNHEFQFHIGGYLPPFQTLQTIVLPVTKKPEIQVNMELAAFFKNIDLSKTHSIMSPSAEAVKMAKLLATIFHVHAP